MGGPLRALCLASGRMTAWWPRPDSNGHVPFGTTDFKSGASTNSATGPRRRAESQEGSGVKAQGQDQPVNDALGAAMLSLST